MDRIDILHIQMKHARESFPALPAFAHHDDRIADLDLGVLHGSIRTLGQEDFGGAKSLLRELDQLCHAGDHEIRGYRVVALGNWFYFSCHVAIVGSIQAERIVKNRLHSTSGT